MSGFATLADLHAALGKPRIKVRFSKGAPPSGAVNGAASYWTSAGSATAPAGAAPGSTAAVAPTRSTTGALQFPLASSGSKVRHLGRAIFGGGSAALSWDLFDRLLHCDGLSGASTSAQAIGGASCPARGLFDAHELYYEWYGATGATPFNGAVTYVNQDGQTKTTPPVAVPASVGVGRLIHVPLFPGDWQVQSLVSHAGDANSGLAGNVGLTLVRRLAFAACDRSIPRPIPQDALYLGVPRVPDDACLFFALGFTSSSLVACNGVLSFPEADA